MRQTRAYLITVLGVLFGTTMLYRFGTTEPEFIPTYLVIAVIGAILLWAGKGVWSGQLKWYSPHAWMILSLFLVEAAGSASVVIYKADSELYGRPFTAEELFPSVLLGLIGVMMYMVGWRIGPKRPGFGPRLSVYFSDTALVASLFTIGCLFIFGMSMLAWLYMYSTGGGMGGQLQNQGGGRRELVNSAGGFVWHVARFGYAAVLLMIARYGIKNPFALVMFLVYSLMLFVWGSRSYFAIVFIGAIVVYQRRFKPNLSLLKVGALAAALLLIANVLIGLRMTQGDTGATKEVVVDRLSDMDLFLQSQLANVTFSAYRAEVMISAGEPNGIPFQNGKTMLSLLDIIPNFIWDNSALRTSGPALYMQYLAPEKIGKTSLAISLFGELYINFRWFGTAICCLLVGVIFRWMHSRLIESEHYMYPSIPVTVISALLAVFVMRFVKMGVFDLISLFYVLLPIFLLYLPNLPLALSTSASMQHRQQAALPDQR